MADEGQIGSLVLTLISTVLSLLYSREEGGVRENGREEK